MNSGSSSRRRSVDGNFRIVWERKSGPKCLDIIFPDPEQSRSGFMEMGRKPGRSDFASWLDGSERDGWNLGARLAGSGAQYDGVKWRLWDSGA